MKKLNNKGFTLVELLAVIVVLAIIMIIAIPSVLKSMNNAKKGAFKIEAQKVLNTAQQIYESDEMLNSYQAASHNTEGTYYCYTLDELGVTTGNTYKGFVEIIVDGATNEASYYLTLSDKSYSVASKEYKEINNDSNSISNTAITTDGSLECPGTRQTGTMATD